MFQHELLLQQMGEQRGRYNKMLQGVYQQHNAEVTTLKDDHKQFVDLLTQSIDQFRATTVSVSIRLMLMY